MKPQEQSILFDISICKEIISMLQGINLVIDVSHMITEKENELSAPYRNLESHIRQRLGLSDMP